MNFRPLGPSAITISLDETTSEADLSEFWPRWRPRAQASRRGSPGQRHRAADSLGAAAQERVPATPGLRAVHSRLRCCATSGAGGTRSLTDPLHDPARLVHHEAEWHGRDGAISWPKWGRLHPFARPTRAGLPSHVRELEACSGDGPPVFGAVSLPAQCGLAGRVHRPVVIRRYHTRVARAIVTCA